LCLLVNQEDVHFLGLQGVSSEQFVSHGFYDRGPGLISVSQAFLVPCASCIPIFANSIPVFIAPIHFFSIFFLVQSPFYHILAAKKFQFCPFNPIFVSSPSFGRVLAGPAGNSEKSSGCWGPGCCRRIPRCNREGGRITKNWACFIAKLGLTRDL
jgi:hypothetical protein